jgi:hypothetical protein
MRKLALVAAGVAALLAFAGSAAAIQDVNESRMVGGGWIGNPEIAPNPTIKVRDGMVLHCDPTVSGNSLEVTWGGGDYFHLTRLDSATCDRNVPGVDDGGVISGSGQGRCNGEHAFISFTFSDNTEIRAVPDEAEIAIEGDDPDVCSLSTGGLLPLLGGNFTFIDDPNI